MMAPPKAISGTTVVFPQKTRLSLPWLKRSSAAVSVMTMFPVVLLGADAHCSLQKLTICPSEAGRDAHLWSVHRPVHQFVHKGTRLPFPACHILRRLRPSGDKAQRVRDGQ